MFCFRGIGIAPLFVVLALGCGKDCPTCVSPPDKDTIPPTVESVTPPNGANNVSVTDSVVVVFSEVVDPVSVTSKTFFVAKESTTVAVRSTISVSGATATLTIEDSLDYLTKYVVVVSRVRDRAGNVMRGEYRSAFITAQNPLLWKLPAKYLARYVAINTSGEYVSGSMQDTVSRASIPGFFVSKFNLEGKREWLVETGDETCGLVADAQAVYVGRMFDTDILSGRREVYVDKRSAETGELIWSSLVGTDGRCFDIAVNEMGIYLVADIPANYVIRLSLENGVVTRFLDVLHRIGFGVRSVITAAHSIAVGENAVYISGSTQADLINQIPDGSAGSFDFFVAAYDVDFEKRLWLSQWRNPSNQYWANSTSFVPDAGLVVVGGMQGPFGIDHRAVLLAYESKTGEFRWSRIFEGTPTSGSSMGAVDSDGSAIYLTLGGAEMPPSPQKLRSDGSSVWIGSPPSKAGGIAVGNNTVFVANGTNKLIRYDAGAGVVKQ